MFSSILSRCLALLLLLLLLSTLISPLDVENFTSLVQVEVKLVRLTKLPPVRSCRMFREKTSPEALNTHKIYALIH
jgi:hypothetical protein